MPGTHGNSQYLAIGAAANALTDVSGSLASADLPVTPQTFPLAGSREQAANMSGEKLDWSLEFEVDDNSTTEPLLYGKEGDTLFFQRVKAGNTSGNRRETGSGIISSLRNPVSADSKRTWAVTVIPAEADLTRDTVP